MVCVYPVLSHTLMFYVYTSTITKFRITWSIYVDSSARARSFALVQVLALTCSLKYLELAGMLPCSCTSTIIIIIIDTHQNRCKCENEGEKK